MSDAAGEHAEICAESVAVSLGAETSKFLDEKALESFDRQTRLEESFWGSLPLLSGGLIAAGAIISGIANSLPTPEFSIFSILAYVTVTGAIGLFGWSLWWLWQAIKPHDFDYLPDDALVADFAERLTKFYVDQGLPVEDRDKAVAFELRAFMRNAYVEAAKSAFRHNQERLSARSQVIVCLLLSFVLAFAADGLEIGHMLLYAAPHAKALPHGN